MRSAERTLENRCEISSTARPGHGGRMLSNSSCSARASRAAVGSSRMMNGASRKNALARATRCHWPTDSSLPPWNSGPSTVSYPLGRGGQEVCGAAVQGRPPDALEVADALVAAHADVLRGRQGVVQEVLEDDCDRAAQLVGGDGGRVDPVPQPAG